MLEFSFVELGLSIDEFYDLSLYEWNLHVERRKKQIKDEYNRWEQSAALAREIMALVANVNRNSKRKPAPFVGSDFIKLSFDKETTSTKGRLMTPEEVEAKFKNVKFVKDKPINGIQ